MPAIPCNHCKGTGAKPQPKGVYGTIEDCFRCKGSGIENYCTACNGTGKNTEDDDFPSGLVDWSSCRFCHGMKHELDHINVPIPKEILIRDRGEAFADVEAYEIHEEYTEGYNRHKNLDWFDWGI
jgi:RecJ-like exonuclease